MTNVKIIEAQDIGTINDGAFLIFEYFQQTAGNRKNFDTSNYSRLDDIVTKTMSGEHTMIVAYYDDKAVGVGGISKHGELQHLYVTKDYRGLGIAEHIVKERLSRGAWFSVVHKENIASQNLMKKCGLVAHAHYGNYKMFTIPKSIDE